MANHNSEFIKEITTRGFIHQATDIDNLDKLLINENSVPAYIGFDCTAPSLHVGSLIQIMLLRWYQKCGHKPLILIGGGTTLIGDPSGKDEARKLLDNETIKKNTLGIENVFKKFINFDKSNNSALVVNNSEWLTKINYINFLRDYGKHFSINRMLGFDSVKLRLDREQPLSFLEFNYMILQAYDFHELNNRYGCMLQMGGSDQWGNIVNGVELHRRVNTNDKTFKTIYGLTSPLITTSSGNKMGKTAKGAIWLNEELCSPWDYWQFWRNTEDKDVIRFIKLFTDLEFSEIKKLEKLQGSEINDAKIILADSTTTLLHGKKSAKEAEKTAKSLFSNENTEANLPYIEYTKSELKIGVSILDCFIKNNHLVNTKGDARRLIRGGGAKLNDVNITNEGYILTERDFSETNELKLSAGKKKHILIRKI